jgi:hypothetical protein
VIPTGGGHPDFELDDGVGDGRDGTGDAAEGREMIQRTAGGSVVDGGEVALLDAREGDGGVRKFETGETLAYLCDR